MTSNAAGTRLTFRSGAGSPARSRGPILDVGAGTGRVTLELARAGHDVTALDSDADLLAELARRAGGLPVTTVCADARSFALDRRFGLVMVPMQTVQLLGGARGRAAFLARARDAPEPGGPGRRSRSPRSSSHSRSSAGTIGPLPDVCERDGIVYSSLPTAVRADGDGFWLERERETVTVAGEHQQHSDRIRLDAVSADLLEQEAAAAGLRVQPREEIAPTDDHVGSRVVILGG